MILQNLLYQLIKGLAHCHKHGVMHRDLKVGIVIAQLINFTCNNPDALMWAGVVLMY